MNLHFNKKEIGFDILDYEWEGKYNESLFSLGAFKKINLFVGTNNSGKSRFLRGLLEYDENLLQISRNEIPLRYFHQEFINKLNILPDIRSLEPISKLKKLNTQFSYFEFTRNYHSYKSIIEENLSEINSLNKTLEKYKLSSYHSLPYERRLDLLNALKQFNDEILFAKKHTSKSRKYIPILRSLHDNSNLRQSAFEETVKKNYGINVNKIHSGLNIYKEILNLKNSQQRDRKKVEKFEKFLSHHFFENKKVFITSNLGSDEILFSVNDVEYPVHHIGNGIQSLIIILFSIFTANENDWFFIEEPETNLHPGLQRVFIETLLNDEYLNTKNLRFFFTTHSNHFLDTSLVNDNISIFQFKKEEDDSFVIKNNIKPNREVLDLLGVRNTSVFLSNTSLWVEGPTDRKYLSKFLKLFCKHNNYQPLKEDIDYAFFEYGGNLIEHYLFDENVGFDENDVREKINSFALSSKIYLLSDNDNARPNSKKGQRREFLKAIENKKFRYQNTEVKEIENLLPKKVIKDFMSELLSSELSIQKSEKFRFKRDDYKNVGLGDFYEKLFLDRKIPKKDFKKFKANSGTLKNEYKNKLVNFFINSNYKYLELIEDNDELEKLIKVLYTFIKDS